MSYVTYTQTGPFNPGGPPGISSAFLNNVEAFLAALWSDSAITSNHAGILTVAGLVTGSNLLQLGRVTAAVNGSTSGTLTLYEFMVGTTSLKIAGCFFNGYKNAGSALSLPLNAPFTVGAFLAANIGGNGLQLWNSGSQLTTSIGVLTALASGGGSISTVNNLPQNSIGNCKSAFDTIKEPGGNSSTATGFGFFVGI